MADAVKPSRRHPITVLSAEQVTVQIMDPDTALPVDTPDDSAVVPGKVRKYVGMLAAISKDSQQNAALRAEAYLTGGKSSVKPKSFKGVLPERRKAARRYGEWKLWKRSPDVKKRDIFDLTTALSVIIDVILSDTPEKFDSATDLTSKVIAQMLSSGCSYTRMLFTIPSAFAHTDWESLAKALLSSGLLKLDDDAWAAELSACRAHAADLTRRLHVGAGEACTGTTAGGGSGVIASRVSKTDAEAGAGTGSGSRARLAPLSPLSLPPILIEWLTGEDWSGWAAAADQLENDSIGLVPFPASCISSVWSRDPKHISIDSPKQAQNLLISLSNALARSIDRGWNSKAVHSLFEEALNYYRQVQRKEDTKGTKAGTMYLSREALHKAVHEEFRKFPPYLADVTDIPRGTLGAGSGAN
jgi:hypothetical protein